jgi:hypothetical protein
MAQQSGPRRFVTTLRYIAVAIGTLLLAELFVQLVLSRTIEESLWFTDDIHTRNDKYGFVFTPNYRGWMRHADQVYLAPLHLDAHGFRLPASMPDARQNIVMIGGFSMTFSYGLTDDQTLHHSVAAALSKPSTLYNTAWPGFEQFRNFHIYKDTLARDVQPDFAVLLFYTETLDSFASLPGDFSQFSENGAPRRDMFRYFDHLAVDPPEDGLPLALGSLYYRSIIAHKLGYRVAKVEGLIEKKLGTAHAAGREQTADRGIARDRFAAWTAYLQDYFGGKGRVLFVFLPGVDPRFQSRLDYYDELIAQLPKDADYLDLQSSLLEQTGKTGYLGWGHYSPTTAALLGKAIAQRIEQVQDARVSADRE